MTLKVGIVASMTSPQMDFQHIGATSPPRGVTTSPPAETGIGRKALPPTEENWPTAVNLSFVGQV